MALNYSPKAEELHAIGREGARRIRNWLNATGRFAIAYSATELDAARRGFSQVEVELLDGSCERFDLVGDVLDEEGRFARTVYIECKKYSGAGDQGPLYDEYLAVAYSAFARWYERHGGPPGWDFMWVTTHPFAQTRYSKLTTDESIRASVTGEHAGRLNGHAYDEDLGRELAKRLWLCIVSDRMLEEMRMGRRFVALVQQEMALARMDA